MARVVLDASAILVLLNDEPGAAWAAGALRAKTRKAALSLGDRACLALAKDLAVPAITSDAAWAKVSAGVEVRLLR